MSDRGIKKVRIARGALPPINSDTEQYVVRYRILSEDRNRVSHWSPQYLLDPNPIIIVEDSGISVTQTGTFLTVTWEDEDESPAYDVFVSWGTSPGSTGLETFYTTVSGQFVVIPIPTDEVYVASQVTIQRVVRPKRLVESMIVAQSSIISLS